MITTKLESDSPVTFVTYKLLPSVLLRKPALLAQGDLGAFLGLSTYENNITVFRNISLTKFGFLPRVIEPVNINLKKCWED